MLALRHPRKCPIGDQLDGAARRISTGRVFPAQVTEKSVYGNPTATIFVRLSRITSTASAFFVQVDSLSASSANPG
jgi:hypothetical protein